MRRESVINRFGESGEVYRVEYGEKFGFKGADIDRFLKAYDENPQCCHNLEYLIKIGDRKGYINVKSVGIVSSLSDIHTPYGKPLFLRVGAGFREVLERELTNQSAITVLSASKRFCAVAQVREIPDFSKRVNIDCEYFELDIEREQCAKALCIPATQKAVRELKFKFFYEERS